MDKVIRIILSCTDHRQAFSLGKVLMRDRLAATMSIGTCTAREPWLSWRRAGCDTPLVLLTCERVLPFLEDRVREIYPEGAPPLVGRLDAALSPGVAMYARRKLAAPMLH